MVYGHIRALEPDAAPVDIEEPLQVSITPATRLKSGRVGRLNRDLAEAYHVFVNSRWSLRRMTRKLCTMSTHG